MRRMIGSPFALRPLRSPLAGLAIAALLAAAACDEAEKAPTLEAPTLEAPAPLAAKSAEPAAPAPAPAKGAVGAPALLSASAAPPSVPAPAGPAPTSAPAAAKPATVVLLDPGKQPRARLRYVLPASYKGRVGMTMTMGMEMAIAGQNVNMRLPPIRMVMALGVTEKLGDEAVRCTFEVTDAEVMPGGDKMFETMRDKLAADIEKAVGAAGVMVLDHRGVVRNLDLTLPAGMDPQMKLAMESSRQGMEQMSSPLPEEPVGIGARWQVDQRIEQNGLELQQKAIYQLVRLKGKKGKLKTTLTQTATPQIATLPNLPPGVKTEILSLTGAGSGSGDLELDQLIPRAFTIGVKTDTSIKVTGQGPDQTMQMKANTRIDLERL
jgi:hypothetical protein